MKKTVILYDIFEAKCLELITEAVKLRNEGKDLEASLKSRDLALYRIDYYEQFLNEAYKPAQRIWQTQYDNAWKLLGAVNDTIYDLQNSL